MLGGNHVGDVAEAVVAKSSQQPRDADNATGHMSVVLDDDVLYDVLRHLVAVSFRHDAEGQRQQICRCRIVAIEDSVGIERMTGTRRRALLDS